ncbi:hypothetical protein BU26DRAFT_547499 [Trematosphaeria pertusa]|uniref:Ecp2 effector protein domain-containing protein n=1 Tax=Trematosphaeria pertusa TaxID=390896 RepID=A0A6A6ISP7_9PLEO|nr:uncharacterized protein BU26DRAFT_547499 [Trematosphaeria pertusa]KAF2252852.1 hypothetical protein BU26DRAFT_547499 [Trematosphaeria pertusa]
MRSAAAILVATTAFLTAPAVALFDCNADQHAFPVTPGKFVVHYTSIRDSNYDDDAWIRICKPNAQNKWDNVHPLGTQCGAGHPVTFSTSQTSLNHAFKVTNGNGCDWFSSNLDDAAMDYNGQHRDLGADPAAGCGKRDHGISCEFDL